MADKTYGMNGIDGEHLALIEELLAIANNAIKANEYFSHCLMMGMVQGKCERHLAKHKQTEPPECPSCLAAEE